MIKIGNILLDTEGINLIKPASASDGSPRVRIVFKSSDSIYCTFEDLGVKSYEEFLEVFSAADKRKEDKLMFRIMAALQANNEKTQL